MAGIGTSNIKAKELDSPLAWGAGVVHRWSSADVIIDQRDEPGLFYSFLGCLAVCVVDRESYGSDRCSVLVLTGVFKISFISAKHQRRLESQAKSRQVLLIDLTTMPNANIFLH